MYIADKIINNGLWLFIFIKRTEMIVIEIAICPEGKEFSPLSPTTSLILLKTVYGLGLVYVNFKIPSIMDVK